MQDHAETHSKKQISEDGVTELLKKLSISGTTTCCLAVSLLISLLISFLIFCNR